MQINSLEDAYSIIKEHCPMECREGRIFSQKEERVEMPFEYVKKPLSDAAELAAFKTTQIAIRTLSLILEGPALNVDKNIPNIDIGEGVSSINSHIRFSDDRLNAAINFVHKERLRPRPLSNIKSLPNIDESPSKKASPASSCLKNKPCKIYYKKIFFIGIFIFFLIIGIIFFSIIIKIILIDNNISLYEVIIL